MSLSIEQKERKKDNIKRDAILMGCKWEWIINSENELELAQKNNANTNEKNEQNAATKDKKDKIDFRTGRPKLEEQSKSLPKYLPKKQHNTYITLSDVKNAAIHVLSERYYIPNEFLQFCDDTDSRNETHKQILEDFLLHLSNYFYWFFEALDANKLNNPMCIERSHEENDRIENADKMQKITLTGLARAYAMLILGIGSSELHHMNCGRNRVSHGFKDRGIFETLYPFCVFFIWILFSRRDYEAIRAEIGHLMKSDSFNNNIKIETLLLPRNKISKLSGQKENLIKKETILKQFDANRSLSPELQNSINKKHGPLSLLAQRSPALVSILPLPEEKSKWLFLKKGDDLKKILHELDENDLVTIDSEKSILKTEIGILGKLMKQYHKNTLVAKGSTDEEASGDQHQDTHHTNKNESHEIKI